MSNMLEYIEGARAYLDFGEDNLAVIIEEVGFDWILFYFVSPESNFGRDSSRLKIDMADIENTYNGGSRKHLDYVSMISGLRNKGYKLVVSPDGLQDHDFIRPPNILLDKLNYDIEIVSILE